MTETVGAALKAARERRQLTLAQVSEATRVRSHYLQALENDDISAMPSAAQARGFLRIYAEYLGLELEKLIPPAAPVEPEVATEPPVVAAKEPAKRPGLSGVLTSLRERISTARGGQGNASSPDTELSPEGNRVQSSPGKAEHGSADNDKKKRN